MKKILFILLLTGVFTSVAHAQHWVNFSGSKPDAPELNLLKSDAQSVSFEITIPGIYTMDTVVNGVAFTRLILPGSGTINPAGSPEIPVLVYKIAIPDCDKTEVDYKIYSKQTLPSCWIYPVPQIVLEKNPESIEEPVERFSFNPNAYAQSLVPEPAAHISSTGALRAQRYVEVTLVPVEFCPVTKQLSVIDKVEVTLSFANSKGELWQNVGIFNKIAAKAFINYQDNGMSALVNDKAFERTNFTHGSVTYYRLTDTAQACLIVGDYLIITESQFYNSPHLHPLIQHRGYYNGFDVAVISVEDILALNFEYEGNLDPDGNPDEYIKEQKMRTFIRRVYEGQNAQNTGDGRLAYVLLVGDNYEGNTGIPMSKDHDGVETIQGNNEIFPSDYYFSCVTRDAAGSYDNIGDLFIGRFSVENETHLYNMVRKTLNHETEYSPQSWRKTVGATFILGPNYIIRYGNFFRNLLDSHGWNYSIVGGVGTNFNIDVPTLNYLNAGAAYVQHFGYGTATSWGHHGFTQSYLSNMLHNDYKAPFMHALAPYTGHFDNNECLGEFLTRYSDSKGAVGYIGASRYCMFWWNTIYEIMYYQELFPHYLFNDNMSIAGELLLVAKTTSPPTPDLLNHIKAQKYGLNLFGDPALNILAEGYEITRNVTADCLAEITCQVRVHKGATLTVPDNCTLNFLPKGKLIIEETGSLVIGNQALINGLDNEPDTAIHVRGGGFTVGSNVIFQNLPGGVLLEARLRIPSWSYDNAKQYDLSHATFNNTPLRHRNCRLNVSNCIFNPGSDVKTYVSVSIIDNCTFNQTTFLSDHTDMRGDFTLSTTIRNSKFTGNNSHTAIQLKNSTVFDVHNNRITKYETGVSMHGCGTTLVGSMAVIRNNEISSCNTGIELFNSAAGFINNHIYKNFYGVRLFNNTYTAFGSALEPVAPPYQIIGDCKSIELYASACSFPAFFRYNQVIDDDNDGNTHNDPLVWWDVPGRVLPQDVRFNCWGANFDPAEDFYPAGAFIYDPTWCPGRSGSSTQDADETLYQTGLDYFANEDYHNAGLVFKELVETHPQSRFAIAALHELFALEDFKDNDFTALHNYFAAITPEDSNLFNTADFLATRCHVKDKNWQPAIDWYEHRIENPPSYQDSVFAVIDLGDIHLMMEADTVNNAKGAVYQYRHEFKLKSKQEYEARKTTLLATLPQIKKTQTDKPQNPQLPTGSDKKGSLGQNVPNPVSGITTVGYEIYTEGMVEVRIYNISGQLLQILPQGTLGQGSYQTTISLAGVPAGVYHYVLVVNGERTDTKKLVVN